MESLLVKQRAPLYRRSINKTSWAFVRNAAGDMPTWMGAQLEFWGDSSFFINSRKQEGLGIRACLLQLGRTQLTAQQDSKNHCSLSTIVGCDTWAWSLHQPSRCLRTTQLLSCSSCSTRKNYCSFCPHILPSNRGKGCEDLLWVQKVLSCLILTQNLTFFRWLLTGNEFHLERYFLGMENPSLNKPKYVSL